MQVYTYQGLANTGLTEAEVLKRAEAFLRKFENRFGKGSKRLQDAIDDIIDAASEARQGIANQPEATPMDDYTYCGPQHADLARREFPRLTVAPTGLGNFRVSGNAKDMDEFIDLTIQDDDCGGERELQPGYGQG